MIALWIPGKAPTCGKKSVNVIGVTASNMHVCYPVCGLVHVQGRTDRPVSICSLADPSCVTFPQYITSLLVARVDFPFLKEEPCGLVSRLLPSQIPLPPKERLLFRPETSESGSLELFARPAVCSPPRCAFPD